MLCLSPQSLFEHARYAVTGVGESMAFKAR